MTGWSAYMNPSFPGMLRPGLADAVAVLLGLLIVLCLAPFARGATAPGTAPEGTAGGPMAQRGYYITFMRMPTFGLAEWRRAIDGFHDDGANVLLLWMGGGFRSKKFPITWKYNEAHENVRQDFVRDLIDYAHTKGIRVLLGFTPFGYDGVNQYPLEHPELKAVQKNGKPVDAFGIHAWGYNLCPSKEESQQFMLEYVREMLFDFYPNADGLLIESSDYAVCHCPDCAGKFYEREFRFVSRISRDVWERKPDAMIVVYPHYFSGAAVPGLEVKSATQPFDPRWTLFFTPHSTRLDPALLKQARTSLYWNEAPALGGPEAIRQGARMACDSGFTGYVPSLEAYSYVATRPEEGQAYLVGKRQVPLGFGWLEPGRLPYGELPMRVNRIAYREFSQNPDLALDEFKVRLGRELFGDAATPERVADALELQRLFAMERSWSQASPLACPDRVRAMRAGGQLTPEKQAAYRQALDRAAAIAARSKDADAPAGREMHRIASWLLAQWPAENRALLAEEKTLKVRLSWGHQSPKVTPFYVEYLAAQAKIADVSAAGMKDGEGPSAGPWETRAGSGDVRQVEFTLHYPDLPVKPLENLNSIWADLMARSDPDTARRLRADPGYRPDGRRLLVRMDREGTRGFAVTVDQLLQNRAFWVPALDVYLAVGDSPPAWAEHQKQLAAWKGKRILDAVRQEPEATYELYKTRWEDIGSPAYKHPSQPAPGHIVGVTWDSAVPKFGIDRGAGVWNDYGNPDRFRLSFGFGDLGPELVKTWKGQRLADGLPVLTTVFEKEGVRYEVEEFAYPLHGPPAERRGDIPMVLLARLKATDLAKEARTVSFTMTHRREYPADREPAVAARQDGGTLMLEETGAGHTLLSVRGEGLQVRPPRVEVKRTKADDPKSPHEATTTLEVALDMPAGGSRELVVKLPSPVVPTADRPALLGLDYAACREATLKFWSAYGTRGARFRVPEREVNELYEANLWHALRLPRRHGGRGSDITIDLPYSNFAYAQTGTPWPINQAVYVDYMLYDLRGYHDLAAEELLVMFRKNQEPSGRVGGYANWTVYTPGMVYAVAQHYLLSQDRSSLEALLPCTLKAADWCLAETRRTSQDPGPAAGLARGPLNDLTGDGVWAFSQAYIYAALDLLGQALDRAGHPRAGEFRDAARTFRASVRQAFAKASARSPLVQVRDHTWMPYVPCEATTDHRLVEQWYPTEVDSGALHLARLKVLAPEDPLTEYLLQDHEDNLYLNGWGMANEPVYNQQATAYLLRDEPKAVIRAFYSMMACAFSHSVYEPVEHRWTWGQYFGPPSTDGAWAELYRRMLVEELDDGGLLLLAATPRKWLANGKAIEIERAPTWYGPLSARVESRVDAGMICAEVSLAGPDRPRAILVRLRHPEARPMRSVRVNGAEWTAFDTRKEWVRIDNPRETLYKLEARY